MKEPEAFSDEVKEIREAGEVKDFPDGGLDVGDLEFAAFAEHRFVDSSYDRHPLSIPASRTPDAARHGVSRRTYQATSSGP